MSKTTKRTLLTWIGIFVLEDGAMIPTTYLTDAGFHYDSTPVAEFDYRDRKRFTDVLSDFLKLGNPEMEAPSPEQVKNEVSPVQDRIKAKSWKEVERRSIWFSVEKFADGYVVKAWGRAADGTWGPDKEPVLNHSLSTDASPQNIVDLILAHLSQRSDLPGLPLTTNKP